jgi:hypothetical protein
VTAEAVEREERVEAVAQAILNFDAPEKFAGFVEMEMLEQSVDAAALKTLGSKGPVPQPPMYILSPSINFRYVEICAHGWKGFTCRVFWVHSCL